MKSSLRSGACDLGEFFTFNPSAPAEARHLRQLIFTFVESWNNYFLLAHKAE